jgi:Sperm-tail PG-rich repeat
LKQIADYNVSTRFLFSSFSETDGNPGPTYNPTDASLYRYRYDPKYSIATRTKSLANFQTPGPDSKPTDLDVYKTRSPRYPMFQRNKELTLDRIPGANAYDTAEAKTKVLKHNPAYSMRSKTSDLSKDKRPGPASYDLRFFIPFDKNPAYSMRRKHSEYAHVAIVPMDNC